MSSPVTTSPAPQEPQAERRRFLLQIEQSLNNGSFLRLVLGKARRDSDLTRVEIRRLTIQGKALLSFRLQKARSEETKNHSLQEALQEIERLVPQDFLAATLLCKDADWVLQYSKKLAARLYSSKPSTRAEVNADGSVSPAEQPHNRPKSYLVPEDSPFLSHLGITNSQGRVRAERSDKFRQINKFIEIIQSLAQEAALEAAAELRVVDYGSGKNYLTFALYDYFRKLRTQPAQVTGVEARSELVQQGNEIASCCRFDNLRFEQGEIATSALGSAQIVVALHACDTATDDAIVCALRMQARVIALAPCCQKYVRPKIRLPAELEPIFKHGIMLERLAESLTNGLRALVLEAHGYHSKVFEFIGGEHTAKNVMITATCSAPSPKLNHARLKEISSIKERFGLRDFYLDRALGLA